MVATLRQLPSGVGMDIEEIRRRAQGAHQFQFGNLRFEPATAKLTNVVRGNAIEFGPIRSAVLTRLAQSECDRKTLAASSAT